MKLRKTKRNCNVTQINCIPTRLQKLLYIRNKVANSMLLRKKKMLSNNNCLGLDLVQVTKY